VETDVTVRDNTPDLSFDKVASCGEKATNASMDKLDLCGLLDWWQKCWKGGTFLHRAESTRKGGKTDNRIVERQKKERQRVS
jgi:hypothetical protein